MKKKKKVHVEKKPYPERMLNAYQLCINKGYSMAKASELADVFLEDFMHDFEKYGVVAELEPGDGIVLRWKPKQER